MKYPFNYLIYISFLGFRYHGWQKQEGIKTVQGMIDKTFWCIFEHYNFKTLGASRTDAMVSAKEFAFQLFLKEEVSQNDLLKKLNLNLPPDIKAIRIDRVDHDFNIIKDSKVKQYHYNFSFGEKFHPFCAPYMTYIPDDLDINKMKEGALLFVGEHNFKSYAYKPNENATFVREILSSEIVICKDQELSFFPKEYYIYKVRGKGFLRHQVKYMIGTLIDLGLGVITLADIDKSLSQEASEPIGHIAPSSGLLLNSVEF